MKLVAFFALQSWVHSVSSFHPLATFTKNPHSTFDTSTFTRTTTTYPRQQEHQQVNLALLPPNLSQGETIFQQTCSSCHVGGSNVIAKERSLQREALETFLGLNFVDQLNESSNIANFVKDSNFHRGAMAFTGRLSDEDLKDVAAFVYIQAMENKWR